MLDVKSPCPAHGELVCNILGHICRDVTGHSRPHFNVDPRLEQKDRVVGSIIPHPDEAWSVHCELLGCKPYAGLNYCVVEYLCGHLVDEDLELVGGGGAGVEVDP